MRIANLLSGIVNLSYLNNLGAATKTLSLTLKSFTYDGFEVKGSATIKRSRVNEIGKPQANVVSKFNGIWPDESAASFSAYKSREWIEGYVSGSGVIFFIMVNATYFIKLKSVFQKVNMVPLRREWSCRFIVSGVLSITRNKATASVDFGDGSSDSNEILTTPNGNPKRCHSDVSSTNRKRIQ